MINNKKKELCEIIPKKIPTSEERKIIHWEIFWKKSIYIPRIRISIICSLESPWIRTLETGDVEKNWNNRNGEENQNSIIVKQFW